MQINAAEFSVLERFLSYVKIDTQSNPHSTSVPSTEKQKNLSNVLVKELQSLGITDAHVDDKGYVYATLPSNSKKQVPTICFCSHVDTSPDYSGTNVQPILHENYDGSVIRFPNNSEITLNPKEHPDLNNQIGGTVITADGTTLLGADNKAGVAEIMAAVHYLVEHPEIKHGAIKILFTPDEEIGRGAQHVDMQKLGAQFGYTIDGETLGSFEDETFSADGISFTFYGVSTHPGFAYNKMVNAIKVASHFVDLLPKNGLSPETTQGEEGFFHPVEFNALAEKATVSFIVRSFKTEELANFEQQLIQIAEQAIAAFPGSKMEYVVKEQYRNMKEIIDKYPQVSALALKAIEQSGIVPIQRSIRGGTDGSQLSFMGMPCPNIFAGEHAFHGPYEWVSLEDMQKATEVIVRLCSLWEQES